MGKRKPAPPRRIWLVWVPEGPFGGGFWDYAASKGCVEDIVNTWAIEGRPVTRQYVPRLPKPYGPRKKP